MLLPSCLLTLAHPVIEKLKGEEAYPIRIGMYRVIYEIDDTNIIVTVVSAGHRKDIYD